MIGSAILIALLAAGPDANMLRRELDAVAVRIEQLKARRMAGEPVEKELGPLLVRIQELASELDRMRPEPPRSAVASSDDPVHERVDELREQAGALRAQADRLTGTLSALEARIAGALRSLTAPPAAPAAGGAPARAALTSGTSAASRTAPADPETIAALVEQRMRVEARIRALRTAAAQLDAEADALDRQ